MLIPNCPAASRCACIDARFATETRSSGGSSEADMNALAVMPRTLPEDAAVMTVTPDANRPMTRRNSDDSVNGACSAVATRFTSTLPSEVVAELPWIGEIRNAPSVEVVFRHTFLGESLETIRVARGHCAEQRVSPDFLGRPAVIDFVQLMTAAEFAGDAVPQQLHQF